MREDAKFCAAQTRGVHDAGMNEFINDDDVVFAEQRANCSDGSSVTRRKCQRRCRAFKCGERFLKFMMWRERTADEP